MIETRENTSCDIDVFSSAYITSIVGYRLQYTTDCKNGSLPTLCIHDMRLLKSDLVGAAVLDRFCHTCRIALLRRLVSF